MFVTTTSKYPRGETLKLDCPEDEDVGLVIILVTQGEE